MPLIPRPAYRLAQGSEVSNYQRMQFPFVWTTTGKTTWVWLAPRPVPQPRCRFYADNLGTGQRIYVTDWLTGTPELYNGIAKYTVTYDLPTGDYLLSADIEHLSLALAAPFPKPMRMIREANPAPQTHVAFVQSRWDHDYNTCSPGAIILPVPPEPPVPFSTPAVHRDMPTTQTYQPAKNIWSRQIGLFTPGFNRMIQETARRVGTTRVTCLTGDANKQQYESYDIHPRPPRLPHIAGQRGQATTAQPLHVHIRAYSPPGDPMTLKSGWSAWICYGHGVEEVWLDGQNDTLAGTEVIPGQYPPDWQVGTSQGSGAPFIDQAWYASHFRVRGNWINCTPGFWEPWSSTARPMSIPHGAPGHSHVGHEGWVTDTFNHRLIYVNHMTAHQGDHYMLAEWGPDSYTPPAAPHGETDCVQLAGNADLTPTEGLCHAPWYIVDPYLNETLADRESFRDRLPFTNFWGDSIAWVNRKTGALTPLALSTVHIVPDTKEIADGRKVWDRPKMRGLYPQPSMTDWFPLDQIVLIRPSAMGFYSDGNLWVFSDALGLQFEIDWRGNRAKVTRVSSNAVTSGWHTAACDWRGEYGPKDHIRYGTWVAGSDTAVTRAGVVLGRGLQCEGSYRPLQGPATQVRTGAYLGGVDMRGGMLMWGDSGQYALYVNSLALPTDPVFDGLRYQRGNDTWTEAWTVRGGPLYLSHGDRGQGRLGLPTLYEMSTWDDARLKAYFRAEGIDEDRLDDLIYSIRWDAGAPPPVIPPDTQPPSVPTGLAVTSAQEPSMLHVTAQCDQSADQPDPTKRAAHYHFYCNGTERVVVDAPSDPAAPVEAMFTLDPNAEPGPWAVQVAAGDDAAPENVSALSDAVVGTPTVVWE